MAKARTVESLQVKKAEIEWAVKAYEDKLSRARADLAHITAALAIFEATGDRKATTAYANFNGIWKHGDLFRLCQRFLKAEGPLSTRELAQRALSASGMDSSDKVLAQVATGKIVYIMRAQERRHSIRRVGMRADVCVWDLPSNLS